MISVRSLVLFFGPVLLPKAIAYYRSAKASPRAAGVSIQPVSPRIAIALGLLAFLSFSYVVKTLPWFAPENLFVKTQSRLQIPVDVLFNRVGALRGNNMLTASDHSLRAKFVNLESKLLYLQFGPDVMSGCPFCNSDEPNTYLSYAIPTLMWSHLANTIIIAMVTSSTFTGTYGAQCRTFAIIVAGILFGLDCYFLSSYNYQSNARALRLEDIDFFHWSMRNYRLLALAALNGGLGWVLWLSATNRAFVQAPSNAERVERLNRSLMSVKSKLNAVGIIKNTALRDEDLRSRSQAYWVHEVRLMRDVMEEREVIEGVNDALENRINIANITRDAETYADNVLQPMAL